MSLGVEYNVLERVRTFVSTKVPSKVQYISSYDTLSTFESTKVQLYVVVGLHVIVTYTRSAVVQRCTCRPYSCTKVQFTARCTPRLFNGNNSVQLYTVHVQYVYLHVRACTFEGTKVLLPEVRVQLYTYSRAAVLCGCCVRVVVVVCCTASFVSTSWYFRTSVLLYTYIVAV